MKFSIVIPVYNKANQIIPTIESVFRQKFTDYEVVLVNDGSTDNLLQVLQPYAGRIRVINQKNGGVSVARNTGIQAAEGEFICFLDGDDEWLPDHLDLLQGLTCKYPHSDVFVTSHIVHFPNGKEQCSSAKVEACSMDEVCDDFLGLLNRFGYGLVHTNSMCIRKQFMLCHNISFMPGIRIGEDTDVWYRAALYAAVVFSKKATTVYHRENSTATKNSFFTENWIFSLREKDLLSDPDIPDQRKQSYLRLLDRYQLTCSRELMMRKQRDAAKKALNNVRYKTGKRYRLMYVFCRLPYAVCKIAYQHLMNKGK